MGREERCIDGFDASLETGEEGSSKFRVVEFFQRQPVGEGWVGGWVEGLKGKFLTYQEVQCVCL